MLPGVATESTEDDAADLPVRGELPRATLDFGEHTSEYARPGGQIYLARQLGGLPDVPVLRGLREQQLFVVLVGEPGVGKTALIEAAYPDLLTVQCSGDMTLPHLVGTHLPTPGGGWQWHDGPLVTAMRAGLVLYLDEINMMPVEVSTVLHAAMDGRGTLRIDDLPGEPVVTAAPGFFVAAAYNPGRVKERHPSEALLSRFAVRIETQTDYDAARALGVLEEFVTIAENLRVRDEADRASGGLGLWVPQMRELLIAQRLIDTGLGAEFAARALVGQCPRVEELAEVAEVANHVLGFEVQPLAVGPQVEAPQETTAGRTA